MYNNPLQQTCRLSCFLQKNGGWLGKKACQLAQAAEFHRKAVEHNIKEET